MRRRLRAQNPGFTVVRRGRLLLCRVMLWFSGKRDRGALWRDLNLNLNRAVDALVSKCSLQVGLNWNVDGREPSLGHQHLLAGLLGRGRGEYASKAARIAFEEERVPDPRDAVRRRWQRLSDQEGGELFGCRWTESIAYMF